MDSPALSASPPVDSDSPTMWSKAPAFLIGLGALGAVIGVIANPKQLGYSYLLAYMFFLSLCLGSLFLVMLHHLLDASWSVPIRRFLEHIAFLLPWMALLYIPIAILARKIYPWMSMAHPDHDILIKRLYLNPYTFYLRAIVCFGIWSWLSYKLRYWSLRQDESGSAECTYKMRKFAAVGIFLFALTLTMAAIDWMKSLQYQWYSTMYGVYYFAGSTWLTIGTAYVLALLFDRLGYLHGLMTPTTYYYLGSLLFAFTVFYAYIHFFQYFIIWNANIPDETFWYVLRERGTWWDIGMLIIFGHFFVPFLILLRIDVKLTFWLMVFLGAWCWLNHYADLAFNIMPELHPANFSLQWTDLACLALIGGVLSKVFVRYFLAHPAFPVRDPRLKEALTSHEILPDEPPLHGEI